MAPSATTSEMPLEGIKNVTSGVEGPEEGSKSSLNGESSPRTKLYTDAYTHGYTEGYIKGNGVPRQMPIAIVGMSCRLPGDVSTPDEFWEMCSRARSGWSEIPKNRFEAGSFYHPNPGKGGCFNAKGGHFLSEDLGLFDAPFFSLTSQEATSMDPQLRMLLECTFEALENSGIPKHTVVGKDVGVFIGGSFSEYQSQSFADTDTIPMYDATGCAFAMQSNRISHFFDLQGPSFTLDTACSSSLVALHQACQSIRNNECGSAIVGGCHLNMLPDFWISMSMSRLFSDEGRSFSFDSRGTGYGRGEGCGIVILKPLDQALKDNDVIRSVIVASGVNQDGKTPGITMPNGTAQESLMRSVYQHAGIDPKDTGYVEAHGTGTKVGDPIEASALHAVFSEGRSARNPLFIGSVKSNIGHLEAASGIISVIKTALMLERGFILPNYDFKKPNEKIPFSQWHLKVPVSQRPWPRPKRFASVNNFGFGGTNAHVVLEKAPFLKKEEDQEETGSQLRKLFVLSANDKYTLEVLMKNMGIYLEQRPEIFQDNLMSNIAYTLGQRRSLHQWRVAIPAASSFDLIQSLNSGKITPVRGDVEGLRIGFIFTGQGAQYHNMGRELYEQYPAYSKTMEACDKYLLSLGAPFSLIHELSKDATSSLVNEAHISQPACTAVQLALTDLLRSWDISPVAVAGHSSGEIGAAYAAGVLTLESAMAISYYRGMATKGLKKKFPLLKGSMLAVGGTKEDIEPLLAGLDATGGKASIACYNSPTSLTISGDEPAIDEIQRVLEQNQVFNRKLQVDMAYHSHHMDLIAPEYRRCIENLPLPRTTEIQFHSSLLGKLIDASLLEPSYWVDNLTQSVRFSEAVTSMSMSTNGYKTGVSTIIEIGPHSALAGPVKQILKACARTEICYSSALTRKRDAVEASLDMASTLFAKGANLDLGAINISKSTPELLIDMPRYPWNHKTRYWHENRIIKQHKTRPALRHDLLGTLATYSNDLEPTWRNVLRIDDLPWLRDHQIQSLVLFPMSGFISMAVQAMSQKAAERDYDNFHLREVAVHTPLIMTDADVEVTLQVRPHREGSSGSDNSQDSWDEFKIHSWTTSKGWTEHCRGLITVKAGGSLAAKSTLEYIEGSAKVAVDKSKFYESLSELGVSYGPSFQGMNECQASDSCSTAAITTIDTTQEMPQNTQTDSVIHTAFLEQLIEMYWPILGAGPGRTSLKTVYLPSSIGDLSISRKISQAANKPGDSLRAFCKATLPQSNVMPFQPSMLAVAVDSDEVLISLKDLTVAPIIEKDNTGIEAPRELCYKLEWEPVALEPLEISRNGCKETTGVRGTTLSNGAPNGVLNGNTNGTGESHGFLFEELIIVYGDCSAQRTLAMELADSFEPLMGNRPALGTFSNLDTNNTSGKLCLFVAELDDNILSSLTSSQFAALQNLLTAVSGILWVIRGAYVDSTNPNANMVTGLSRSIRSETLLKFATLDLDPESKASTTVETILNVFKSAFGPAAEGNGTLEFTERNGVILTPRIVLDEGLNEYVHKEIHGVSILEPTSFLESGRQLKMAIGSPGASESLHFVDQTLDAPLLDDEIEVEVKAIGMNADDMILLETSKLGKECSGVVTKAGGAVTDLAVGDRVACLPISQGAYSSVTRTKSQFAFRIPDDLRFQEAASIPVAYCTAYYGLVDIGRLLRDERIMVFGGESAVGQATIHLARMLGAEVFSTVKNAESKDYLIETCGLPEKRISVGFNSSLERSETSGFDLVSSCTPSDSDTMRELWDSLDGFGRFVEIREKESHINRTLELTSLRRNRSFMSVELTSVALERPKLIKRLLSDISELLEKGKIQPVAITVFPISNVEGAFNTLRDEHVNGKLVVLPQAGDQVKATPENGKKLLRPDASYILIGGTGGLGRSMARWMSRQGARNLVLVSRTGIIAGEVRKLMDELAVVGTQIFVKKCDASNRDSVDALIHRDMMGIPEIKGVIHGAMVLKDVLFEKMTYDQYMAVMEPKVRGAMHFHDALKSTSLDFFVAISSAAGAVGNRGQATYSAANTFLNGFVQYRRNLGLPAASLDLTAVSDAGYLAENVNAAAEVSRNLGSDTICEAEVLALLGAAINGRLEGCNNHAITGMRLTTPSAPFWVNDAKFKRLKLAMEATGNIEEVTVSFNAALKAAMSLEDAEQVVQKGLLSKLPSVLMLEAEDMDVTRSLSSYALDSLVAIEVRNFITREFEANLQVLELLSSGSIETLSKAICVKSKLVSFNVEQ